MTNPEEHNLKGWLTELVELTSAVKCNDLFDALLVDHSRAEFERRSRRIQAIAAHVRSYGIDDEMWEMAVREQDHVDSEEAVSAHDTQPTRLGDTVVIHKVVSDDTDENEMRRAV